MGDLSGIKIPLDRILEKKRSFSSTEFSEIENSLEKIREKTSHFKGDRNNLEKVICASFFDGDLTSNLSEEDRQGDGSTSSPILGNHTNSGLKIPPLNPIGSAFVSPHKTKIHEERIVRPNNEPLVSNPERTQSVFDLLLQNSRNGAPSPPEQPVQVQNPLENPSLESSSIMENILTEYLIGMPSTLEEFYKIMGEIYVKELLKNFTHIKSPQELMKLTILGSARSGGDSTSNALLNNLLQHILNQNRSHPAQNSVIEPDILRSLISENHESAVQGSLAQDAGRDAPQFPGLNPARSNSKSQSVDEEVIRTSPIAAPKPQRKRLKKQQSKQRDLDPVISQLGDKFKQWTIQEHNPLIERAKKLLRKRNAAMKGARMSKANKHHGELHEEDLKNFNSKTDSSTEMTIKQIFEEILETSINHL